MLSTVKGSRGGTSSGQNGDSGLTPCYMLGSRIAFCDVLSILESWIVLVNETHALLGWPR